MALMTAGGAPTAPASPAPLTPNGFDVDGTLWVEKAKTRNIAGARHGVVHERARQQLPAVRIVDRMLQQRLPDALHDAAMDLAFEQKRIDGAAEVVDDRVAFDGDDAGLRIDLDLDDVAAVGKGLCRRHAAMRGVESRLHAGRQFRRIARRLRHFEKIEAEIGAGDRESSVGKGNVAAAETSIRWAASALPFSTMVLLAS